MSAREQLQRRQPSRPAVMEKQMNRINIDMTIVARNITGKAAIPVCEPIGVTKSVVLHRFDDDQLHILVDGCGGYKATLHPHTPHEVLLREGNLSEFGGGCSGGASAEDPEVLVTLPGSPADWSVWRISQNLTDRWGYLNYCNSKNKHLGSLEEDKALLDRLRSQMWDEMTFIVRKDGQYGILFECECVSQESEARTGESDDGLKPHVEMIGLIDEAAVELSGLFPGVEFAIPDEDKIIEGRPALWAFVRDGLLDAKDRERLGRLMLQI